MLWIALRFPLLPLDLFLRGSPLSEPFAVAEQQRIHSCDAKARARGVLPGQTLSAALAIAPRLRLRDRDPAGETEALLGLAAWATQFTPSVALDFPDGLALEIEGSQRLFGGLESLLEKIRSELKGLGYQAAIGVATTPRAAAWLSRAPDSAPVTDPDALEARLDELPLAVLRLPQDIATALRTLGVTTLRDLRALPRDGLARRFGPQLLLDMDRALGRTPEPRSCYVSPPRFEATLELPADVTQTEALLFAANRLFLQLAAFLAGRASGTTGFRLRLRHRESRSTDLDMGLVAPSRDARHFGLLARERMASLRLSEPVRAIVLEASNIVALADENANLLMEPGKAAGDWPRLVERLRARLGSESVYALTTVEDHRPERASQPLKAEQRRAPKSPPAVFGERPQASVGERPQTSVSERPFWLLDAPRPIEEIGSTPHYRGPLALLTNPERIKSGWWDGDKVARDYFIARTREGAFVWVYRERGVLAGGRWYLHGLFA